MGVCVKVFVCGGHVVQKGDGCVRVCKEYLKVYWEEVYGGLGFEVVVL